MLRALFIAVLALTPPARVTAPPPTANDIPHEPLVVYEVSGFTFAGAIDRELLLYQDGSARLSSATTGPNGSSRLVVVPALDAIALLSSLSEAGAFQLADQTRTYSDTPLSTLTVMRPLTDARAHTFSWWSADGSYAPIEQLLNNFIANAFPGM